MNSKPVISDADDITSEELFARLPNATQAFEVEYYDDFSDFNEFYDKVFDQQYKAPIYPYRYGSYQIYQANRKNHTYAFTTFLNITSQDVAALYPQWMYQSIIANAANSPDLKYEVTTQPFPVFYAFIQREEAA